MLKITDAVEEVLFDDEEALVACSKGYMNLSGYAALIRREVESKTKKEVKVPTIVVALSRLQGRTKKMPPMIVGVKINSINTKAPITELVYGKNERLVKKVASLAGAVDATPDDFLNMTISTNEVAIICSERILPKVRAYLGVRPRMEAGGLAMIGLTVDPTYYTRPNITYSLIRRIARKRIVLAETISTYGEIIFVFKHKNLAEMLKLFSA